MVKASAAAKPNVADDCCTPRAFDLALDDEQAELLARRFDALGDPVRLKMLAMMLASPRGEVCVCDFSNKLGRKQPLVSYHLKVLSDAGLITSERRGTWSWYSIGPEHLAFVGELIG
jgi:ArsR family transcriptional regulator